MFRLFLTSLDRRDDRRARTLRERLGPGGVLLSWYRVDSPVEGGRTTVRRPWLARASRPDWPGTIERRGRSRSQAARRAIRALDRLVSASDQT